MTHDLIHVVVHKGKKETLDICFEMHSNLTEELSNRWGKERQNMELA